MKYTMFDSEGRSWEMETLPRSVTPNFIGMTEEEKQKMRKETEVLDLLGVYELVRETNKEERY